MHVVQPVFPLFPCHRSFVCVWWAGWAWWCWCGVLRWWSHCRSCVSVRCYPCVCCSCVCVCRTLTTHQYSTLLYICQVSAYSVHGAHTVRRGVSVGILLGVRVGVCVGVLGERGVGAWARGHVGTWARGHVCGGRGRAPPHTCGRRGDTLHCKCHPPPCNDPVSEIRVGFLKLIVTKQLKV